MEEYHVGIDFGLSNSHIGIYKDGMVQIVPNKLGERNIPSIVCFTDQNKVLVGEEAISQKMDEFNKIIYEVKKFIGLSYQQFIKREYDKNLNYEVVNKDGIPKIRININGNESFYSAEDITSLILQKMVKYAEDFIGQIDKVVKINKAIITVPDHFSMSQTEAMRRAAERAGIEILRIIKEHTAAAIAYGLGKDLILHSSVYQNKKFYELRKIYSDKSNENLDTFPPISFDKSSEKVIVFDLGGRTFDITLLNIIKNSEDNINFDIFATNGDIHLGVSDFDNKLIDYCINEYCKQTGDKQENVRQNKLSYKRLKIKCENAKKLLSTSKEVIINVENFISNNDLFVKITKELFDDLCSDLYERIEQVINEIFEESVISKPEIDKIILVGGATRIIGVKNLLYRLFGESKVKDNINPEEVVAFGASLESAKMIGIDKNNFYLQEISAFKLGIALNNPDPNDKKGKLMYTFIKKFSKIPVSIEKKFKINLTKEKPNIFIEIYEGNEKYAYKNTFLGEMKIDNLNKLGTIEYVVKFIVDVYGQLTVTFIVDSLGIKKQETINKITLAYLDNVKKKIKIIKYRNLKNLYNDITISYKKLSKTNDLKQELEILQNLSNIYQKLVQIYLFFATDNGLVYGRIYVYIKDLFKCYIQILKFKGKININIQEIIQKIKENMSYLISSLKYVDELLDMFNEIKEEPNFKNEYYEIFINYIELLNKEGLDKKGSKNFSRYYSKLYFEKAFYSIIQIFKESDFNGLDKSIKERFNKEKMIAETEYKKINSFTEIIERRIKDGVFQYENTEYSMIGKKIERFEKDISSMTKEELLEMLDLFKNMVDSFDKTQNSMAEAYCISNIILINHIYFKKRYKQLKPYIFRFNTIINKNKNENYEWISCAKEIIENMI